MKPNHRQHTQGKNEQMWIQSDVPTRRGKSGKEKSLNRARKSLKKKDQKKKKSSNTAIANHKREIFFSFLNNYFASFMFSIIVYFMFDEN